MFQQQYFINENERIELQIPGNKFGRYYLEIIFDYNDIEELRKSENRQVAFNMMIHNGKKEKLRSYEIELVKAEYGRRFLICKVPFEFFSFSDPIKLELYDFEFSEGFESYHPSMKITVSRFSSWFWD